MAQRTAPASDVRRAPRFLRGVWRHRWPYLFISPFFVLFAVFMLYPILFSVWLSFHEWQGIGAMRPVGFENYADLLRDSFFWNSLLNTGIIFVIHVPVLIFGSIVIATLLHDNFLRFQGMWRALVFLPHLTSMVAAGFVFRLIFDGDGAIANQFLTVLGASPVPFFNTVGGARFVLGLLLVWAWLGYDTVIMLAGLQTIPSEITEAARVDGAGRFQLFWRITVPLLRPVIAFALTLSVIGTLQLFTEPYILTGGGPLRGTETPVMRIFSSTFDSLRFGYAAAMSYVFFATIVVAALLQFRLLNRE